MSARNENDKYPAILVCDRYMTNVENPDSFAFRKRVFSAHFFSISAVFMSTKCRNICGCTAQKKQSKPCKTKDYTKQYIKITQPEL